MRFALRRNGAQTAPPALRSRKRPLHHAGAHTLLHVRPWRAYMCAYMRGFTPACGRCGADMQAGVTVRNARGCSLQRCARQRERAHAGRCGGTRAFAHAHHRVKSRWANAGSSPSRAIHSRALFCHTRRCVHRADRSIRSSSGAVRRHLRAQRVRVLLERAEVPHLRAKGHSSGAVRSHHAALWLQRIAALRCNQIAQVVVGCVARRSALP